MTEGPAESSGSPDGVNSPGAARSPEADATGAAGVVVDIRHGGVPTDEEVAAIVAAVEATWPAAAGEEARPTSAPRWRFSGRWWSKPVPLRRSRPW